MFWTQELMRKHLSEWVHNNIQALESQTPFKASVLKSGRSGFVVSISISVTANDC